MLRWHANENLWMMFAINMTDTMNTTKSPMYPLQEIDFGKTFEGLCSLALLRDDMYLRIFEPRRPFVDDLEIESCATISTWRGPRQRPPS